MLKYDFINKQNAASPLFFYNNTNNYIIMKIKYVLELKIELKN